MIKLSMLVPPPGRSAGAKRTGFTLIELSIVLVIIGLIVGSVFVGRDLIHAAEIRATVKQVEQFDAAINTFQGKFNCLPGDCSDPKAFGFTSYKAINGVHQAPAAGNGDGLISDDVIGTETYNAFWWLENAGLIEGVNIGYKSGGGQAFYTVIPAVIGIPQSYSNAGWSLSYATWDVTYVDTGKDITPGNQFFPESGHYYLLSSDIEWSGIPTAITPADAYAIDVKMDDGLPRSGRVLASGNDIPDGPDGVTVPVSDPTGAVFGAADEGTAGNGAGNAYCVVSATPPVYNVQNTSQINGNTNLVNPAISSLCVLGIKASF